MLKKLLPIFVLFFALSVKAQVDPLLAKDSIAQQKWVDSVMNKMTVKQKIGQLFMVQAYSNKHKNSEHIKKLIRDYEVGGIVFMQGTPAGHATLINEYQHLTKIPILMSIDAEWGLDMRIDNTFAFPYNMPLGAVRDNQLIEEFGKHLAKHLKRIGLQLDFAPVVDINTNPKNPIIGNRSFGSDKYNVTEKAVAFTKGMQGEHILACAKHFPGHGETLKDSHKTLPTVDFSAERIDSVELFPYKELFKEGIASIMAAHLSVPSLEPNASLPTSLSKNVITDLLQKKMKYKGLIITDALNMKGAANYAKPGDVDLIAFLAGNDILLFSESVPAAYNKIKEAYDKKVITDERLDHSVRKILKAKYWSGLNEFKPVDLNNLTEDLNTISDEILNRRLVANSVTLIKNDNDLLPIKDLKDNRIAYVKFGKYDNKVFVDRLKDYTKVDVIKADHIDQLMTRLRTYNTVIIGFHTKGSSAYASYKFTEEQLHWLQEIARKHRVILDVFASPYSLLQIKTFKNIEAVMISYQNIEIFQDLSAQMIFGAVDIQGKLPVNIGDEFPVGFGLHVANLHRLGYTIPEEVDLDSHKLAKIDSVAKVVIDSMMAPGMQVLVARHGKVVYRKSFGYYTYDSIRKVDNSSIYDLASVTKILGGLPMVMKAYEEGKFTLNTTLGKLLPYLKGTNKDTLTVKEVLSHYSKMKPYITYYKSTLDPKTKKPQPEFIHSAPSKEYSVKVADHMYLKKDFEKQIWKDIAEAPQLRTLRYKYSGLPFYLIKRYMEKVYKKPLDVLDHEYFYDPLGATTMTYNPLNKFPKDRIVPTEKDEFFRFQLLQGTVHDEGAAMLGGVSGNAGLFSSSNDVAKIMQMYLQKGYYGGKSYFKPETFDTFNHRYYEADGVRRGLGFDKPQLDPDIMATCGCTSFKTFGHSGYTGTYTFADPETEIVYVFLSNRVYPTRENTKLFKQDIRPNIQRIIQEAIIR
jgi:beta-glucosidase-like glycosyl hydrolase/CubicO group peptidase (beta-lactamase class C family)